MGIILSSMASMDGMNLVTYRALGAQLLQAFINAQPVFYVSPLSIEPDVPVRGGVPVLFPQFADVGPLLKHGFARNLDWQLIDQDIGNSLRVYQLDISPELRPEWPHAARLRLAVKISDQVLTLHFSVQNTGESAFAWTGGLHPYFLVDDIRCCRITGLNGLAVRDRYDASASRQVDEEAYWGVDPCERLYDGSPALVIDNGARKLVLQATGFDQWMVWNPGEKGGAALQDLPEGDWRRFICVEPVRVTRPVLLAPGESFEGTLSISSVGAGHARD